jgi:hypothetical protein
VIIISTYTGVRCIDTKVLARTYIHSILKILFMLILIIYSADFIISIVNIFCDYLLDMCPTIIFYMKSGKNFPIKQHKDTNMPLAYSKIEVMLTSLSFLIYQFQISSKRLDTIIDYTILFQFQFYFQS